MKKVSTSAFFVLAVLGIQAGAAEFAAKKQIVSLMAEWPSVVDKELVMELNVLNIPRKLQISSIEMESNLKGRLVIVEVSEFQGAKRLEHTLRITPTISVKKVGNAEIMQVEALIVPNGMGGNAKIVTDISSDIREFYFALNFETNETFGFVNNVSLQLMKSETVDGLPPKKTELVKYDIVPLQGELDYPDLIPLPRVIDSEAVLGAKELKVGFRFSRRELDASLTRELKTIGVPAVLSLPSMKVAAGLLGAQLHLPFTDVNENTERPVIVAGTSLFEVSPTTKLPIKFKHDLAPTFDFGSGTAGDSTLKYVLTLEFYTDENFSRVADVKLVLNRVYQGEGEASGVARDEVVKYDLEEVEYQLPIYPGDDR